MLQMNLTTMRNQVCKINTQTGLKEFAKHLHTDLYTEGGHDAQAIDGTSNDDSTGDLSDLSSQFMDEQAQQLKLSVTTCRT